MCMYMYIEKPVMVGPDKPMYMYMYIVHVDLIVSAQQYRDFLMIL